MATPTDTEVFAQPRPLIGGPLVLWTIGLVVFPFLFALAVYERYLPLLGLRESNATIGAAFHVAPRSGAIAVVGAALDITDFSVWVMLVWAYFARSSSARWLMLVFLVLGIAQSALPMVMFGASARETRDVINIVLLAFWLPYVLRSERVRNTFVLGPLPPAAARAAFVAFAILSIAFAGLSVASYRRFSQGSPVKEPVEEAQAAAERDPAFAAWLTSVEKDAIGRGLSGAEKDAFGRQAGAELAANGLLRLPYQKLRRRAVLILRMLDGADDKTCAMRGRGQITYGPLLQLLSVQEQREWYGISTEAMAAEVHGTPPSLSVDDGVGIVAHYSAALPGPEQRQLEDSLKADAPAANACWALRWMYRIGLAADGPKARPYVRWLAVQ